MHRRAGTIFRFGGAKKQSIQSNSKYNFEKAIRSVQWRLGAGEFSRIFVLKVCKVTFNCKLQKNGGADVLVVPPAPPAPSVPALMQKCHGTAAYLQIRLG